MTSSAPDLSGVKAAVITASDSVSRGINTDDSGPAAEKMLAAAGAEVIESLVLPDDVEALTDAITRLAAIAGLIVTTGGTGVGPRDVTPEATVAACTRMVPGLGEQMRRISLEKTPHAMLSRATAGICGRALVLNLPGSPGGVTDCLAAVLPVLGHAIGLLRNEPTAHIQT